MGLAILAYSAVTCTRTHGHADVGACVLYLSVGKARDLSRNTGNKTYPVKQVGNTAAGRHLLHLNAGAGIKAGEEVKVGWRKAA